MSQNQAPYRFNERLYPQGPARTILMIFIALILVTVFVFLSFGHSSYLNNLFLILLLFGLLSLNPNTSKVIIYQNRIEIHPTKLSRIFAKKSTSTYFTFVKKIKINRDKFLSYIEIITRNGDEHRIETYNIEELDNLISNLKTGLGEKWENVVEFI